MNSAPPDDCNRWGRTYFWADGDEEKSTPKVGDYVQWEHNGVLGFPKALRLVKFSDDRTYAWVEGHTTGLPANELIAAEAPPLVVDKGDTGPRVIEVPTGRTSFAGQAPRVPSQKVAGMRQEILSLEEGDAMLQWPENIGKDSIQDVEEWVKFLLKRLRRSLGDGAASQQKPEDTTNQSE